jgi:hypothetical protein
MLAFENKRTHSYRKLLDKLPLSVQKDADAAFALWKSNPQHPSLRWHLLDVKKHVLPNSFSVSFGNGYRAIGRTDNKTVLWYWVGIDTLQPLKWRRFLRLSSIVYLKFFIKLLFRP